MNGPVLAQLIAQGLSEGTDLATLRAIAEEAGEPGADAAGAGRCGGGGDIAELGKLLEAWRNAKRSAVKAAAAWAVRMLLALVLVTLAVKGGF